MRFLVLILLAGLALTACAEARRLPTGPSVVTTVSPITDLVHQVGCDAIQVDGLVPEGVNSHTFEPRPSHAVLLAEADLFIANGLNLEVPSLELARANLDHPDQVVELAPRVLAESDWIFDFSFPRSGGDPNPHIWTDPTLASAMVDVIREELTDLSPTDSAVFEANAGELKDRLVALDQAIRSATETIPVANRRLLTYHDSFPYFARTYGWEVVGAIQPSEFSEPTAAEVAALIDQIRTERLPAIFGSEVFPSPVLEVIAAETGAVYADDLRDDDLPGEEGDPGHGYLGLMVSNLTTMVESLGGDAGTLATVDTSPVCR